MATNISKRCLVYIPEQAQTLQILKIILVILNIIGLITLMISQNLFI